MLRRDFVLLSVASAVTPSVATRAERLASAAKAQVGVTKAYDAAYTRLAYPNGDVPRSTGVCADVIVRAYRDALRLDLQQLLHEDMTRDFAAYPRTWGMTHPDASIDQRRVLNLETFFARQGTQRWRASSPTAGDALPAPVDVGDVLTWRLNAKLPHIGVVVGTGWMGTRVVHNWGNGAEEAALSTFAPHRAVGQYRWQLG